MALVRNAANTLRKGRIGETTYYTSKGRQIARQSLNNSNYGESARRSLAQQKRRVKWANLVNFYKLCSGWMPKAFESKKPGQTDYNKFMQLNVNAQRVALTRDQAINGGCVIDAFDITQGTLASVTTGAGTGGAYAATRLNCSVIQDVNTTVGQFAAALISGNADIESGMQLSIVRAKCTEDVNGIPRTEVKFYEVVLDPSSEELLSKYIPNNIMSGEEGKLVISNEDTVNGGSAAIISKLTDTGLKVSSETLAGAFTMAAQYSTAAVVEAAIATYGVDKEVILNPDSAEPVV